MILRSTHKTIVDLLQQQLTTQAVTIGDLREELREMRQGYEARIEKLTNQLVVALRPPVFVTTLAPPAVNAAFPSPPEGDEVGSEFDTPAPLMPIMTRQGPKLAGTPYVPQPPRPFTSPPPPEPPSESPPEKADS